MALALRVCQWVRNRREETREMSYAYLLGRSGTETYSSAGQKLKNVGEVRVLHELNEKHEFSARAGDREARHQHYRESNLWPDIRYAPPLCCRGCQ